MKKTFSRRRQFFGDGHCSGENEKKGNEKEHSERTHCGAWDEKRSLWSLCVVRLAETSTATRAKTRFLHQIGIRNTSHRSQLKSLNNG